MFITATYRPISFKDPTGLEPEKEKGGEDEMLWTEIQQDITAFAAISLAIMNDLEGANQRALAELLSANPLSMQYWNSGLPILEMGYVWAGGGGGGDSRTGVKANGKDAKNGIKKSVEDYYEDYVSFDDDGFVEITEEGKKLADEDKGSNLYKLFVLSENTRYIFNVFGVDKSTLFNVFIYFTDIKSYADETQWSLNDLRGQGIFLSDKTNIWNHPYSSIGPVIYFDKNLIISDISMLVAHELLFHGYLFNNGSNWRHSNLLDIIVNNSLKRKR